MDIPLRVSLPGQPWSVVAASPSGPLYVLCGSDDVLLGDRQLIAVDLAGKVLWRREIEGDPNGHGYQLSYTQHLRVSETGTVWLVNAAEDSVLLIGYAPSGDTAHVIRLDHDPTEVPGAFALVREGFCTTWTTLGPHRDIRVDIRDEAGDARWSARVQTSPMAYEGLVGMIGGKVAPLEPELPRAFGPSYSDPLLVSGDRILAGFRDYGSGLEVCHLLDRRTGRLLLTTEPAPGGHKAVAGPREFLVGEQGYGGFATTRYAADGAETGRWESHGALVVDPSGVIRSVEMENILPSRRRFRVFGARGSLVDGPPLPGYYTTPPALDVSGTVVFFRDRALRVIDAGLSERVLGTTDEDEQLLGRMVLLEDGLVAFTHGHQLLLARTGLGELAPGIWPCGDGNLRGNPVVEGP